MEMMVSHRGKNDRDATNDVILKENEEDDRFLVGFVGRGVVRGLVSTVDLLDYPGGSVGLNWAVGALDLTVTVAVLGLAVEVSPLYLCSVILAY